MYKTITLDSSYSLSYLEIIQSYIDFDYEYFNMYYSKQDDKVHVNIDNFSYEITPKEVVKELFEHKGDEGVEYILPMIINKKHKQHETK